MPSPRIFVSYATTGDPHGAEVAARLIDDLRSSGAEVVTDNEQAGSPVPFLERELPYCQYFILVQTPNAQQSLRVQTALRMALNLASQQRIGILHLIATPSNQDEQISWTTNRIFDATQDYARARDKMMLELGLISLDNSTIFSTRGGVNPLPRPVPSAPPAQQSISPTVYAGSPGPASQGQSIYSPPANPTVYPPSYGSGGFPGEPRTVVAGSSQPAVPALNESPISIYSPPSKPASPAPYKPVPVASKRTTNRSSSRGSDRPPAISEHGTVPLWVAIVLGVVVVLLIASNVFLFLTRGVTPKAGPVATPTVNPTVATTGTKNPYGGDGRLSLNDPLIPQGHDNKNPYQWAIAKKPAKGKDYKGCMFTNNGYELHTTSPLYCLASKTVFNNFVYQVQMQITQGTSGGLIFRADNNSHHYYRFLIDIYGNYFLYSSNTTTPGGADFTLVSGGLSPAIKQGYSNPNLLAVKVVDANIYLYVNLQLVAYIQDIHYTSGNVGVTTGAASDSGSGTTAVIFRYAKVWTL